MSERKYYVISYDVVSNKRRRKIAKLLEKHGIRVQKSVFDCLISEKEYLSLKNKLEKIINFDEDSIRYYNLCLKCLSNITTAGILPITADFNRSIII